MTTLTAPSTESCNISRDHLTSSEVQLFYPTDFYSIGLNDSLATVVIIINHSFNPYRSTHWLIF